MRLEGTLDAFSLPDIFQLLSYTKKTGALHLRREQQHGVVHLREGVVSGARSDITRQALGRRLVGAGLVDDDALADAVEKVLDEPGAGLARAIADGGTVGTELLAQVAAEQATDAVFDLLRWPDGDFAFVVDEPDPDDLGATLPVDEVVAEGRRRLQSWESLAPSLPLPTSVVTLVASPAVDPTVTREEWALLSLVDGVRSVRELVGLSGKGEYVVVSSLAGLTERGLVAVGEQVAGASPLQQRQQLLAALETGPVEPELVAPARPTAAVIPERPEPFTPARQVEHAEEPVPALARFASATARATASPVGAAMSALPAATSPAGSRQAANASRSGATTRQQVGAPYARSSAGTSPSGSSGTSGGGVGAVLGAHALQPDLSHGQPDPQPDAASSTSSYIDRDPAVNKSLLLRLIAGVRGL